VQRSAAPHTFSKNAKNVTVQKYHISFGLAMPFKECGTDTAGKRMRATRKLREIFFREILRISAQKAGKRRIKLYNVLKFAKYHENVFLFWQKCVNISTKAVCIW
jgi:hypothetical protein